MDQNEAFKELSTGLFPSVVAEQLFKYHRMGDPFCYDAMDRVREQNLSQPENNRAYFEHDAVFGIYRWRSYADKDIQYEHTTISAEIKTSLRDLLEDKKMNQYLGATPLFFLAVPEELLPAAVSKIQEDPAVGQFKGRIFIETGEIVIMPVKQPFVSHERCARLRGQIHASKKRMPWYDRDGLYQLKPIMDNPYSRPEWEKIDGLLVNTKYRDIVLKEQTRKYSLDYHREIAKQQRAGKKHKYNTDLNS